MMIFALLLWIGRVELQQCECYSDSYGGGPLPLIRLCSDCENLDPYCCEICNPNPCRCTKQNTTPGMCLSTCKCGFACVCLLFA
jgi:hypothetical protein